MATYGKVEEFKEDEEWVEYIERLTHYFTANDIEDEDKQRSILLSVCGAKTYKLIRNLVAPDKPDSKTFKELAELVQNHRNPKPSEIVQRFKFNSRFRKEGESVATYVAELRQLTEHCNFGGVLEDMLRDRLVCGINDDRIQRRLLSETTLNFKKAYEMAVGMETAAKNARDIQQGSMTLEERQTPSGQQHNVNKVNEHMKRQQSGDTPKGIECYRCGGRHKSDECKFKEEECYFCHKKGHIARKCRAKERLNTSNRSRDDQQVAESRKTRQTTNYLQEIEEEEKGYELYNIKSSKPDPYCVNINVNGHEITMEVDTGASVTVISEQTYRQTLKSVPKIQPSDANLHTYTGEEIKVLGLIKVPVEYSNQKATLPAIVVAGKSPNLLGRNWLKYIKLNWQQIFSTSVGKTRVKQNTSNQASKDQKLIEMLGKYQDVFEEGLGTFKATKAKIVVEENASPKYCKARPVPYALKDKIEKELQRLEEEGTIEQVTFSDWAAPIVPIVKEDQSIRICGDYKVTVNSVSKLDNYPIPKAEDLFATLGGGEKFTKLDLSQAYQQLPLEEDSKKYTTINTHRGLFQYNRLPYGISSAPGIFQRTMENLVQGSPYVIVRVDDILVSGENDEEHIANLEEVLKRLSNAGARLKKAKCVFMAPEVIYLGQRINREGIQPVEEKVRAISEAPSPKNASELKSFLGMINYYQKYLPNLASTLAPLHELLRKGAHWKWSTKQQEAFERSKELLKSAELLIHYDSSKELLLACDASPYGVGAVLSHKLEDGSERPIAYASRTLSAPERNYAQLDKEGLAIIFGVKKFHQYLYGRHFTINTDHKPLIGLFNEYKPIPQMASGRVQRWALTLAAYEYSIAYKEGRTHANADALSRLPLPEVPSRIPESGDNLFVMQVLESTPVNAEQIKTETRRDPILARTCKIVQFGWPGECPDEDLRPYYNRRNELSLHDGCLMWGSRVVVPPTLRSLVIEELHDTHPGICRMKALAHSFVWWPKLDSDLEEKVKRCTDCQTHRKTPPEAPLHPWEWPNRPWSRVHVDYAGPFQGKMFLILIDAYSKWMEVFPMNTSTSSATIEKLRTVFATHGLPEKLVSDNGSCFTSEEFEQFLVKNGIKHVTSAPYHPASNGLAERAVQTFKEGMKKMKEGSIETKVSRFLFKYRITPQTTTGVAPAELLMGRKPLSRLDLLTPDVGRRVEKKQQDQKQRHDRHAKDRSFKADSDFSDL